MEGGLSARTPLTSQMATDSSRPFRRGARSLVPPCCPLHFLLATLPSPSRLFASPPPFTKFIILIFVRDLSPLLVPIPPGLTYFSSDPAQLCHFPHHFLPARPISPRPAHPQNHNDPRFRKRQMEISICVSLCGSYLYEYWYKVLTTFDPRFSRFTQLRARPSMFDSDKPSSSHPISASGVTLCFPTRKRSERGRRSPHCPSILLLLYRRSDFLVPRM